MMGRLSIAASLVAVFMLAHPAAALAQWESPTRAFHKDTTFPLEGRHLTVACSSCHVNGVTTSTPVTCESCHWIRRQDDVYRTRLGTACGECHSPMGWTPARWNHEAATGVALNAAHRTLACDTCHADGRFVGTAPTCLSCHQRDYDATLAPNHREAGFPATSCEQCHRPSDVTFAQAHFNHAEVFVLTGIHSTQACEACHTAGRYAGTPRECVGCHRADFERTTAPNHVAAGFSTACETCHGTAPPDWLGAGTEAVNHQAFFPLVGLHGTQSCATCHVNGRYAGTPRECVGCHRTDYDRTASPNHAAAGLATTCESCHRPADPAWTGNGTLDHNQYFPLLGTHAAQTCASCHVGDRYKGTPRDCLGCHRVDFDRTTDPNHAAAGYSTACESCHRVTDTSWLGVRVDHNAYYPLLGRHLTTTCASCHTNGLYKGTTRTCVACHQPDYDRTTDPNHAAAGYSTTCESCHSESAATWLGARVNHEAYYPLVGRHSITSCTSCHGSGVYKGTPTTCVACHQTDYSRTTNPNHTAAGFPVTCESCHNAADAAWTLGRFTHTWFPITSGKHAGNACSVCHTDPGNYKSFTCLTCHEHDRARMDDKHRERAGYRYDSNACYACHPTGRED